MDRRNLIRSAIALALLILVVLFTKPWTWRKGASDDERSRGERVSGVDRERSYGTSPRSGTMHSSPARERDRRTGTPATGDQYPYWIPEMEEQLLEALLTMYRTHTEFSAQDLPLADVLASLEDRDGLPLELTPVYDQRLDELLVTLDLEERSLRDVMDVLLETYGLTWILDLDRGKLLIESLYMLAEPDGGDRPWDMNDWEGGVPGSDEGSLDGEEEARPQVKSLEPLGGEEVRWIGDASPNWRVRLTMVELLCRGQGDERTYLVDDPPYETDQLLERELSALSLDVELEQPQLGEALAFLVEETGVPIYVDDEQFDGTMQIPFYLGPVTLREALTHMARELSAHREGVPMELVVHEGTAMLVKTEDREKIEEKYSAKWKSWDGYRDRISALLGTMVGARYEAQPLREVAAELEETLSTRVILHPTLWEANPAITLDLSLTKLSKALDGIQRASGARWMLGEGDLYLLPAGE